MKLSVPLRLCVLQPAYDEQTTSVYQELDPRCEPSLHLPEHTWESVDVRKASAVAQLQKLAPLGYDAFVNMCDGAVDEDRPGVEVVEALERLELPFTGAGSLFYDPSREGMKLAAAWAGVDTPAWVFVRDDADLDRAALLRFPLIVKHPRGYASVGMTKASRVVDRDELAALARKLVEEFGAALVEEFIEGREFTVLVTEPRAGEKEPWVLAPIECSFPPGETFKHFDLKWVTSDALKWGPVADDALAERLAAESGRYFAALRGTGFGRCDLRMDAEGRLFMLEINANCGIFYPDTAYGSADQIIAHDTGGHRAFLEHLIFCAQRRHQRLRKKNEVALVPGRGYVVYATAAIAAGELVEAGEDLPVTLISRAHVDASWDVERRAAFERYAEDLGGGVFAVAGARPETWRPYERALSPNAERRGRDVVALSAIAPGEAITLAGSPRAAR